jgi:hypothetical protein
MVVQPAQERDGPDADAEPSPPPPAAAADNAADSWVSRPWFGGAIRASLPASFLDASDVRPVPDHQEMWHDARDQGAAVLVEVVEHDSAVADAAAGAHFFADAAEGAGSLPFLAAMVVEEGEQGEAGAAYAGGRGGGSLLLSAPHMPGGRPTAAAGGAFVAGSARGGGGGQQQLVAAALAVFRLPHVQSDVVITSFQPAGEWLLGTDGGAVAAASAPTRPARSLLVAGSAASLAAARRRLARVVATVRVDDWGLFGEGATAPPG